MPYRIGHVRSKLLKSELEGGRGEGDMGLFYCPGLPADEVNAASDACVIGHCFCDQGSTKRPIKGCDVRNADIYPWLSAKLVHHE